jgi:hypothetical protein
MKLIQIQDFANKYQTMVFTTSMQPLGMIHCLAATEWEAIAYDGNRHIGWFTTKSAAIAALTA